MLPDDKVPVALRRVKYGFVWVRTWSSRISQKVSVKLSTVGGDPVDQQTQGKLKSPVIIQSAIPLPEAFLRYLLNSSKNASSTSGGL